MNIIDLTEAYQIEFLARGDREAYEKSHPELFEHYYQFWVDRQRPLATVSPETIETRKGWISGHLQKLNPALLTHALDIEEVDIVLFIGSGQTNGHAFRHHDRTLVWLPLETYPSEEQVLIFVTHELAHGLHYQLSPSCDFHSKAEKLLLSRQLITEGLATYLTRELLGVSSLKALWADYLTGAEAEAWWQRCTDNEEHLFQMIVAHYDRSDHDLGLFFANDPKDIYQFRAGYYAGLILIDRYVRQEKLTLTQLLRLARPKLTEDILRLLMR